MAGREANSDERQDKANGEAESNKEEQEEEANCPSQSSERFNSFVERREEFEFEFELEVKMD